MEEKLINENLVLFDVEAETREDVIRCIAERMDSEGRLADKQGYVDAVLKRESSSSTAVGFSVATPHAKTDAAKVATLAFARLKKEIAWDEDENASIIFQIAIPAKDKGERHLQILAALSRKLVHGDFRDKIMAATDPKEVLELIGEV